MDGKTRLRSGPPPGLRSSSPSSVVREVFREPVDDLHGRGDPVRERPEGDLHRTVLITKKLSEIRGAVHRERKTLIRGRIWRILRLIRMRFLLKNIKTGLDGFRILGRLHGQIQSHPDKHLVLDLTGVTFIEAIMCAALAVVLEPYRARGGQVTPIGLCAEVETVFQRNGFFRQFELRDGHVPDFYGTTIEHRRFACSDHENFGQYVEQHFRGKGLPEMSPALARKFRESIHELFENAAHHSEAELGIFACGQQFPKTNRLKFSIADAGIGFSGSIRRRLGREMSPGRAIQWAVEGNTTRMVRDRRPGGLGLQIIREFIRLNRGCVLIASQSGYWFENAGRRTLRELSFPFPGSVVTIDIDTADANSYDLASDIDPETIF